MVLPTMQSATWRSMHYGNDSVQIEYDDPHFCSDCTYVVGVFGYMNTSYTILATTSFNQVVRLTVSKHRSNFRYQTISYYMISYHIISHHVTSHRITSHHVTLYHVMYYLIHLSLFPKLFINLTLLTLKKVTVFSLKVHCNIFLTVFKPLLYVD